MAHMYQRARSPYWWIKPKNKPAFSTKLRVGIPNETQKANDWLEREKASERQHVSEPERWEFWVPQYIEERYEESPRSLERYQLRWRSLRAFLTREKIFYPQQLTFNVMTRYVAWRRAGDREYGIWPASKNTTIGDVKFLSLLMRRAIQLSYAVANPCAGLGLKKSKPKEKPEITDAHFAQIIEALAKEPEWMLTNFTICYYTGCRLTEAAIPMDCADVEKRFIHFPDTKGDKPFTVPMRDELVPLFKRLHKEKRARACEPPKLASMASLAFYKFFKRIKLPQYCVHCCRVTFISKGARAGIPERDMMRLVNHASEEIHRIYRRFQPEDLRAALQKIQLPALTMHDSPENPDAPSSTPQTQTAG